MKLIFANIAFLSFLYFLKWMGISTRTHKDKLWNNGVYSKCKKGFFKSFDTDSSGAVGYRYTECQYGIWQRYDLRFTVKKIIKLVT